MLLKRYDLETARKTILRRRRSEPETYPQALLDNLAERFGPGTAPEDAVAQLLRSVREGGDQALRKWTEELDGARLDSFLVPRQDLEDSYNALDPVLRDALLHSAQRIREFHARQPIASWTTDEMGGLIGQRVTPVRNVGVYVPGGSAPLPSSLLMSVIPAQVAGVKQIIVCTPPNPHAAILAAAYICQIDQVYQLGGAQAIGAMAYGTESVPAVDKIVGAGNLFVTLAKQQVFGVVGLDGLAGPTETMVIADATARPAWVASDLLAQAEHDPLASAILLTPDEGVAEAVQREVERQAPLLSRAEIITQALKRRGGVVITPDLQTAAQVADAYAAEHLCLSVEDPNALAAMIQNAGGFFLGEGSFEVLGDYVAGPSHVMPTGGTARFNSPLNVLDFVKISSIVQLDQATSARLSALAGEIARAERLTAHAAAADQRARGNDV